MFRLLSERHIPLPRLRILTGSMGLIGSRARRQPGHYAGANAKALEAYVQGGGRLIVASNAETDFEIAPTVKLWKDPDGAYFRIRNKSLFPSLKDTDVVFMYGDYRQVKAEGESAITFIPPSMYGPPEFVHIDWKDTEDAGLVLKSIGAGKIAWLPWDIGGLYYRHSSEAHAKLMSDLIDSMLPSGRQLTTNAHPLVEITIMRQNERLLLHLVNLSGHSDTAYFDPIRMTGINIGVKGSFRSARAVRSGESMPVANGTGYARFQLAALDEYELIELR